VEKARPTSVGQCKRVLGGVEIGKNCRQSSSALPTFLMLFEKALQAMRFRKSILALTPGFLDAFGPVLANDTFEKYLVLNAGPIHFIRVNAIPIDRIEISMFQVDRM
jgi:hypothetical protein